MSQSSPKPKQLVIEINPNVYRELTIIAESVGFRDLQALVQNYLREVALSARSEIATLETRQQIAEGSNDLDHLRPNPTDKSN